MDSGILYCTTHTSEPSKSVLHGPDLKKTPFQGRRRLIAETDGLDKCAKGSRGPKKIANMHKNEQIDEVTVQKKKTLYIAIKPNAACNDPIRSTD